MRNAVTCSALAWLMFAGSLHAQSSSDFYKDKTIDLYIGVSTGGGYDLYARTIARFMGRHIPGNPAIVPKNMDGAGSVRMVNFLYNAAPKDGLAFGATTSGAAFEGLFGSPLVQYDATKFNWLGSANNDVSVCVANATSGVATIEDMKTKPLVMGGNGGAADTDQFTYVVNGIVGAKMKVIQGYAGGPEINLAMERGEVQGRCGWGWTSLMATKPEWIRDKTVNVLIQTALTKHRDLPNVPLILDLATTDEQRQILRLVFARSSMGRPYLAPPGVPADRIAILRRAFLDTLRDKEFLAEAEKARLEVNPVGPDEVEKLVQDAFATPPDTIKKTAEMLKGH